MTNQDIRVSTEWEHSITNLLGHAPTTEPGIALRQWILHQGVENHLDLLSWEEEEIKANPTQQVFSLDEHGQGSYLRTNQTKQLCGLITYMKHIFSEYMSTGVRTDPFHPFSPEEWSHQTSTMMRTFLVQNLPTPIGPEPVTSGPIPSSKPAAYSPAALELMSFKKGIKSEITAYPSLKDERYFDGFKRSLFIVAKTHECSDVLDPTYTPGSEPEEQELFEAKQTFMFSVFNTNLQTDMGKTIVRRHLASTDAQAVWKELSEHMKTSSKGASEKRRLTQYVTNTVLDDNFKGTTEQFVLHFNEQFRQLEEISEDDERLPSSVKLTLLQTAVRSINDLRIVETLDEFQSTTHGHGSSTSLSFDTYYDLLLNACVRYDKTKKANIGKRRNVYATNMDDTYVDLPTACIDDVPDSPYGGIDLPPDEFYQVHALSSRHPPPQRPGQPTRPPFRPPSQNSRPTNPIRRYDGPIFLPPQIYRLLSEDALKALKAYNTEAISRFHKRKVHNTEIVEEPQDDPPGPPVSENDLPDLPESDLNIPEDPILDFVNSQCHSSEDLDQALQAYQAFQIPSPQDSTMTPERTINHHFTYHIAQASQAKHGSLVDRGANGGLAGSDVRILSRSSRKCTVTGIDSHELQGLDVVQCAALVETNHGIVNLIMNEYACYGKGHTIHSSGQIEWFKNSVDDRSVQVGGKQRICTTDGYTMPLTCKVGLMYLSIIGKPTDQDLERYPAVHLTGPHEWDPSVLDYTHPSGDGEPPWSNDPEERYAFDPNFDEFGDYTQRAIQTLSILDDSSSTLTPSSNYLANQHDFRTSQHAVKHEAPDYEKFRPYFGWVNVDTVQKTMQQSTQWGVSLPNTFPMKRHLKSRNPALNVPRRHEAVATDTVFSDTPAVDSGVKQAQVFVGRDTLVADAYPMKSGKQFVNTLEDNIRRRGAMDKLLSDSAKTEISNKVMDILRAYHISNWHSEPYHQNQNPAEWRYRTIKSWTNTVMNRSGAPANCWLLCLIYVCYLLNHIACTALDGKMPLLALTGITPDISIILLFTFYQPVFYATYDQHFPSESEERAGYWVGFGEHCGDAMTHKILDQDTQKIIYRSAVRPKKSSTPNHRLAPHGGEVSTSSDPSEDKNSSGSPTGAPEGSSPGQKAPTVFIRSRDEENPSGSKPMPTFDPSDLIGRTFLLPPEENGERHRAKVTRKVVEIIDQEDGKRVENINFILDIGNGKVEELISYNQLLEHLENAQDHDMGMDQELFKFRAIIGHQGPLLASDPDWKGSKYNVQVEWETGEITFEPLSIIAADDPVTCAAYAKEKDLLALEGWRRFRSLAKKDKVLARAIKQSKIRQVRRSQTYMFGYLIPRNYMEAMQFDSENKNSKWYDAIKLEMESMAEYKVFKKWDKAILDKHKKVKNPPKGYHRIKVHLVFAVKFDGRHKARLVADGHLTPEPIENIYSGVVSLRNLRLVIFLGKLNNLELWGADIGNAYLEAFTNEDPPKGYKTPLDKNDHPELDTSEILEGDMAAKYLTMVGQLQWLVTLGRFDIHAQVATMSRFRAAPRQGHMDRLKRIYSYAIRTKDYAIRFRTEKPDYSFLPDQDFDWTYSVYGDVHEILPDDMPEPLGESVTTTTTMDANLNHCLATGKSLTGCLHFVNKTPVDWYSKKQATVETATYGSEFVAAKTATEQIMDIRQTLRYLGAPITTKSFLFGDNRSVVTSATLPHSTLTKRHNILAFHRVREAIAAKLMAFYWIQSAYNLSDMLSKHWDHPSVYPMVLKLLITRGNITLIPREATQEKEKEILNPQKEKLKIKEKQN